MASKRKSENPVNKLSPMELVYLTQLHYAQKKQRNGVSADMLAYTPQIEWIVNEMQKEFPNSGWTERLVYRTLIRVRKAGYMEPTERRSKNRLIVPEFVAEDDDLNDETEPLSVDADGKIVEPNDGQ